VAKVGSVERVGGQGSVGVHDQEAILLGEGHILEASGLDLGGDRVARRFVRDELDHA